MTRKTSDVNTLSMQWQKILTAAKSARKLLPSYHTYNNIAQKIV